MNQLLIANEQARQELVERERKRKAKAAEIQRKTEARRQQAKANESQARIEEQARLKAEIQRWFMVMNSWASAADFNAEWKRSKLDLIREYNSRLASVQRM